MKSHLLQFRIHDERLRDSRGPEMLADARIGNRGSAVPVGRGRTPEHGRERKGGLSHHLDTRGDPDKVTRGSLSRVGKNAFFGYN